MNWFTRWINLQGLEVVTQPLSLPVPGMQEDYIRTEGLNKLGWRLIRRKAYLVFSGQLDLLREKADPRWKKGLWIYFRTAQIGDSLMDLAARNFFVRHGCSVDLLCHDSLTHLFHDDEWFHTITSNADSLNPNDYDFVIVQSVHHRALKDKVKYFKSKPWLCMQGYYDVPDFARGPWGAQRLMDFWMVSDRSEIVELGTQKLARRNQVPIKKKSIPLTIVLGGMDPVRTYPYWHEVLSQLAKSVQCEVTLIGIGESATLASQEIEQLNLNLSITNFVNKLSLQDCIDVLAQTQVLLVADGGAMHLAVTVHVPSMVSLFIKGIPPLLRIPEAYHENTLVSATGFVRDIDVQKIVERTFLALTNSSSR